jgi:ABC-type multidrug transport system ATPase subunit
MIEERVNDLLVTMNLSKCKNRQIPEFPALRGEVGGDLRRLSIALELIDLPPLMVIDDPTADFDPAISVGIIQCLQTLARRGHAVVVSMSKPFLQVFAQLDNVVLLSEGFTIYSASPKSIQEYFCGPNMNYELKKGVDLVDFIVDIASGIERPTTQRAADLPNLMLEKFEFSNLFEQPKSGHVTAFSPSFFRLWGYARFDTVLHILYRTLIVIQRAIHTKFKDTEAIQTGLLGASVVSTLCGYLQYNQGNYGQYTVNLLHFPYLNTANICSLFFFCTMFTFAFPFTNVHVICQKLQIFRYEQASGCCTIAAFAIASFLSEVPFLAFYILVFADIIYFMADLSKGYYSYGFFIQTLEMNAMIGLTTAFLLSSILKKELLVRDVFFMTLTLVALLSGFPFQLTTMTSYLANCAVINPLRWTFEGLMQWKFSYYQDGIVWLTTYGFQNFDHNELVHIHERFLLIANAVTVLFLVADPITLARQVRSKGVNGRQPSGSRDSMGSADGFDVSHIPRNVTRNSETVKPVIFMRDSSVTGRTSKLSVNLSQVGEENSDHGPTVMFKDITYRVPDRASPMGHKTILNRVSGQFDWGKLSMIMGAAESGKSSLLRIIAGETGTGSQVTGKILFNNLSPDPAVPLWQRCGLVAADSEHMRDLTVREVLTFAMRLRCLNRLGLKVVEENVKTTVEILHLSE